jgi:hypothetical protein
MPEQIFQNQVLVQIHNAQVLKLIFQLELVLQQSNVHSTMVHYQKSMPV